MQRMLISTLLSQTPIEISFGRTMHFFLFEKKKENQYLVSIHVEPNQYLYLFLCHAFFQPSLHFWQTVNRNNGVWLLGGQGAVEGENKSADESTRAGITQASMLLTSLWRIVDKRTGQTCKQTIRKMCMHTDFT